MAVTRDQDLDGKQSEEPVYKRADGTAMELRRFGAAIPRALRFALVGASNSMVDVAVFSFFVFAVGLGLIPANAIAYLVASTSSYFVNRHWTFKGKTAPASPKDYVTFQIVNGIGFLLATALLVVLAGSMPTLLAKLLSVGASFSWSFLVLDRLVWNRR
ncbi:MAG: GtrA family protein [Pseudomonadota bacterium]